MDIDDDVVVIEHESSLPSLPPHPLANAVKEGLQIADTTTLQSRRPSASDLPSPDIWLCGDCSQRDTSSTQLRKSAHLTSPSCNSWKSQCCHDGRNFRPLQSKDHESSMHQLQYQQIPEPVFRESLPDMPYRTKVDGKIVQYNQSHSASPVSRIDVSERKQNTNHELKSLPPPPVSKP
jgi:hypothetical protein